MPINEWSSNHWGYLHSGGIMIITLPLSIPDGQTRAKTKNGELVPSKNKFVYPAPSLNIQIRESMFAKIRRKQVLEKMIRKLNLTPITGRFILKYTRFCITKLDAIDNMGASMKNIIDVLVEMKLLGNDDDKFVKDVIPKQKKVSKRADERIEIIIIPYQELGGKSWQAPYCIKRRDAFIDRRKPKATLLNSEV